MNKENSMETILPSTPAGYKQLIKTSFTLYRASFTRIILLSLVLSVITFTPRLLSYVIGQDLFLNMSLLSPYQLWMIATDIVALFFLIAILWRMHCVIRGFHEPLIQDFRIGLKKIFYVYIASIIQVIIFLAFASITLGVQFLLIKLQILHLEFWLAFLLVAASTTIQTVIVTYVVILSIFFIPLIAIENKGVIKALKRSIFLAWDHWWSILTTQLTPWLTYLLILMFMRDTLNLDIHIYFLDQGPHNIWATLIHITVFALFIPWVASLLLIQMNDIELRKNLTPSSKR